MLSENELHDLAQKIKDWGRELGFGHVGITDLDVAEHADHLSAWLAKNFHGEMTYMATHSSMRAHPALLVDGATRLISVRMDYLPTANSTIELLEKKEDAYIARYALGRDYHKVMRNRLKKLCEKINTITEHRYRLFSDSAPILEKAFAQNAGLGWIGKNTLLLHKDAGSWFFIGEIITDLPLPADDITTTPRCGSCTACLDVCPTKAFINPFELDARKCIAYLTIEYKGPIEESLRPLMGNRIFGCDDCQMVCPWNKFAQLTKEADFLPRHDLDNKKLIDLFLWSEEDYLNFTEGSAIRRIGYQGWLRNIAIALGNAPYSELIVHALNLNKNHDSELVREHVTWALRQHIQELKIT